MTLSEFEQSIGYTFNNKKFFENAMRHSSYANEHKLGHIGCNERLEFLGDSVLGFITARFLYETYPSKPEGELTKMRAAHVCEGALCEYAKKIGLGEMLLLGRGEELCGGRQRPSALADAFEALLAAIYLDGGLAPVEKFLLPLLRTHTLTENVDFKTALQELVQQHQGQVLSYRLVGSSGPDHEKIFTVSVSLSGKEIGFGNGKSKKEAEQMAARNALRELEHKTL